MLSAEEGAPIVAFRKHTLLALDDCLYALQATIAHATRSSLHRPFQRHAISRLPSVEGEKPRKRFRCPIGYIHIDIAEVRIEEGKLHLFVAIDRVSKFAFAGLHPRATRAVMASVLKPFPMCYGTRFASPGNTHSAAREIRAALAAGELFRAHAFEYACAKVEIDHRLTKPNQLWTNGQVERMNRRIKEATVRRCFHDNRDRLRDHLDLFLRACTFAKRLKAFKDLTPYEHICKTWTEQPDRFRLDPTHHMPGLNS